MDYGASEMGTSQWSHLMVGNGMARPLGLEPSAGGKREGSVADERHKHRLRVGQLSKNGMMVQWPNNHRLAAHGGGDLTAEMGRPVKEDGMTQGRK